MEPLKEVSMEPLSRRMEPWREDSARALRGSVCSLAGVELMVSREA